jgi:hypothetical protein
MFETVMHILILSVCGACLMTLFLLIWALHFPESYNRHKSLWMDMWLFGKEK